MEVLLITGVLGGNAEVKKVNSAKVIEFSVCCTFMERKTWYSCSYWRNADNDCKIADLLTKGSKVAVTGRPSARAYKNKNGDAVGVLEVFVNSVDVMASTKDKEVAYNANDDMPF